MMPKIDRPLDQKNIIIFENKYRLSSLLHKVQKICGKDTLICIFRELTKLHEGIPTTCIIP